jgi:hypothetical protein
METKTKTPTVLESLETMTQNSPKAKELVFNPETGMFEVISDPSEIRPGAVVAGSIAKDGFALTFGSHGK